MNAALQERSIAERIIEALQAHGALDADTLAAKAGVRRILLPTAMNELIRAGKARMQGDSTYALAGLSVVGAPETKSAPAAQLPAGETKVCPSCKPSVAKPLSAFRKVKGGGLSKLCTECWQAAVDAGIARSTAHKSKAEKKPRPVEKRNEAPVSEASPVPAPRPVKVAKPAVFSIPPRPGLDCTIAPAERIAIIRQGNSQVEIHVDDISDVRGWLESAWVALMEHEKL